MKILHLHSNKEWGGGEEQILLLAQGLVKKGVMVEICSPGEGLLFQRAHEVGIDVSDFNHISLGALEGVMVHAHDSASLKVAKKTNRPIVYTRRIMSPLRKSIFSKLKYSPKRIHQMVAISETVKQVLIGGGYPSGKIKVVHCSQDTPLRGLEAIANIRQRTRDDDRHGIIHVRGLHLVLNVNGYNFLL